MLLRFKDIATPSPSQAGAWQEGACPAANGANPLRLNEERSLNFKLGTLLGYASRIMGMDDEDVNKWIGIRGLMRWMTQRFPDLITPDTNVKLTFTEERYGQVSECYGPFSYRQFIQAMGSEEEIAKIHEYIVKSYMPTLKPDMQHETLPAEDKLLLLYSALRYELKRHEGFDRLFLPDDNNEGTAVPEREQSKKPHFMMKDSETMLRHWAGVYSRLIDAKWLWSNEVGCGEWVYVCCGRRTAPAGLVIWHGTTAALAYIVREKFGGKWFVAHQLFTLANGKNLPISFESTKAPCKKVCDQIEIIFDSH